MILYDLHTFFMYINLDLADVHRMLELTLEEAMNREQGIQLVKMFDNYFPEEFLEEYLDYYEMSKNEFIQVLDKHTNKDL